LPPHPKLLNPVIDFSRLPVDARWWQAVQQQLSGADLPEVLSYSESVRFACPGPPPAAAGSSRESVIAR